MCIYCGTSKYRKIYEHHHGPIPVDKNGRTYDIHHIDGNRKNNVPENLIALSIEDHLQIHNDQGDWLACSRIMMRMTSTPEEISKYTSLAAQKKVLEGTHHFLKGEHQGKASRARVNNGTHNFIQEYTCTNCGKIGKGPGMLRHHFDNCNAHTKPKKVKLTKEELSEILSSLTKEFHSRLSPERKKEISNNISKALKGKKKAPTSDVTRELRSKNMRGKKLCPITRKWISLEEYNHIVKMKKDP